MLTQQADYPQLLTAQWVLPVSSGPIENGYVRIVQEKITEVGRLSDLPEALRLPVPRAGTLLTPGLINCHLHLEQSFPELIYKPKHQPFIEWLLQVVQRLKGQSTPLEKRSRCLQGVQELLRTGTTCVNDIASGPESLQVLDECGLRGIVSLEVFHPDYRSIQIEHWVNTYQQFRKGYEFHSRLFVGLSPHSPYNVSPSAWKALQNACQPARLHTHVAEFEDEGRYLKNEPSGIPALHQQILQRTFLPEQAASSPIAYLAQFQLLTPQTIIAHAIHTSLSDRALLQASGATIAHCPRSNLALHGKTLDAREWPSMPLGLGTDGRLSTENLDLRAEARCAMRLHGWSATATLEILTLGGARALGLHQEIGALEPGKWADVVLWQANPNKRLDSPAEMLLAESTQAMRVLVAGATCWEKE